MKSIYFKLTRTVVISFTACFATVSVLAATSFGFDGTLEIPSKCSSFPVNSLSLSDDHFIDGDKSLKWSLSAKATLSFGLESPATNPIIYIPVYSLEENRDTLRFKFYAKDHTTLLRQSDMLLNFNGWREFHRHFDNDFGSSKPTQKYQFVEVTFLSVANSKRKFLFFDGIQLSLPESGTYMKRYPGPFFKIDYEKGYFHDVKNVNTECLDPFISKIPQIEITAAHRKDFGKIKEKFNYKALGGITTASELAVSAAKDTVLSYSITTNADGTVKGNIISKDKFTNYVALRNFSTTLLNLSIAAQNNNDKEAAEALVLFTRFLLDRGLAEGGATFLPTNNYDFCRKNLWMGWVSAMPIYQAYDQSHPGSTLTSEVSRWLRWVYYYGSIYRQDVLDVPGDYIYVASRILFNLAMYNSTEEEQIRDYICAVHFYEKWAQPKPGGWGSGIKIDGTYFHHGAMHNPYSMSMEQWMVDMAKMKNSAFHISKWGYDAISKGVSTELLESATKGNVANFGHSLTGRGPLLMNSRVSLEQFQELIRMGGEAIGQPFEPKMAAVYNYLSKTKTFEVPTVDLDGFYQYNYGSLGVYRGTTGWVANMHGMTSKLWGSEIYNKTNRFGRYQSHGALEVLYNESNVMASGYPDPKVQSWDWNVIPGTTVVRHFPNYWYSIQPTLGEERADEIQKKDFVGALSNGKSGIFAMNFEESAEGWHNKPRYIVTDKLKFKKTVFAHKDMLVCLGSNIAFAPENSRITDTIATNLFQFIFGVDKGAMYMNSSKSMFDDLETNTPLTNKNWVISPAGTGFYLPKQAGTLHLFRGSQYTLPHNVSNTITEKEYNKFWITSDACKAWISHPDRTANKYEFVVIPKTTPKLMKKLEDSLGNGKGFYEILQQDSTAHIVKFPESNLVGYAIFEASNKLTGLLKSASAPCLVMLQLENEKLNLSVCSPDLNYKEDAVSKWVSAPKMITLVVDALWPIPTVLPANVSVSLSEKHTIIQVTLKDGLTTQITF